MKTITKVLPLLTVALLTSGCTTMSGGNYSKRTEKAMKMFNAMDSSFLSKYTGGYISSAFDEPSIYTAAGYYAGTVTFTEKDKLEGYYSEYDNPDAMQKALTLADLDKDKIINRQEARDLMKNIYKQQ